MWQHFTRTGPQLHAGRSPRAYDLVVVGSPVWGGRLCAPVRSWLRTQRSEIGALAGFWVSASGQAYPALGREMEQLTGLPLGGSLALSDQAVKAGGFQEKLASFAAGLRQPERRRA
jgi:hypothetical protein